MSNWGTRAERQLVAAADGLTVPIKPTAVADGAMLRALADLIQHAPEPDAARLDGDLVRAAERGASEHFDDAVEASSASRATRKPRRRRLLLRSGSR